jgi:hypothetical protein
MGNADHSETCEFGTGLRAFLERRGVRFDARLDPSSNVDLLELCTVAKESPASGVLTLQAATATG